jgi:hypothetical protein
MGWFRSVVGERRGSSKETLAVAAVRGHPVHNGSVFNEYEFGEALAQFACLSVAEQHRIADL